MLEKESSNCNNYCELLKEVVLFSRCGYCLNQDLQD
jgi:hypothetical protein